MGSPECITLVQEATRRLGLRHYHDAIELATRAIRLDARHAQAYLVRAMAMRKLNQVDRALADLTLAIRLEPDRPTPYVIRAEILVRRCQFDQAIADATQVIFLDPGNAAAYSVRAQCRHALGDQEGAAEDVQQMLLIDPTRPVPELGARPGSDSPPATAADDERFWKQAGGREDERALFADGKPVDRTYRSRPAVSDEDAPEALGVASGYKPEVIARPIPRMRGRANKSLGHGGGGAILMLGVMMVAGFALWLVIRGATGPEPSTKPAATQVSQVAPSIDPPPSPGSATTQPVEPSPDDRRRRPAVAVAKAHTEQPGSEISAPADAARFEGHAYKFFPEVLSWHRAKARCEEMGGHLATIGSREENDFVRNLALRGITRLGPLDGVWLGATDEHKEGAWEWVDGTGFSFTQWGPDQPNNKQNREHYLLLFLPKNEWSDQPNESTQHVAYFVCEWDGVGQATRVVAPPARTSVSGQAVPEVVSLTELNTTKRDFCPWPSPDGLTIYWVTDTPSDPEGEIWTARRRDAGSLFADKRQVGYGRHIAVSADGLTMFLVARRADGRPGSSIQVARRPTTDEVFGRPQEVSELRSVENPRNLFLSADGRTLVFCDGPFTPAGFRLMMTTRGSPNARWGRPRPVPVAPGRGVQGLMTGPYLFADGRMLLCALEQPSDRPVGRFMACSRNTPDEPFSRPVFLALPQVEDFFGWMPRYVEATRELFFCSNRLASAGNLDLWVVRNFEVVAH